ncbi:alpha/beta hydrolase [Nocardia sp. NPDC056064]|uniref:alpha/beta hydrolase n=1 Tax=Nocardia sp. NPDC056064 TaxID=3345701 RepID=UPI0035E11CC0
MNEGTRREKVSLGVRLLHAVRKDPDWETLTAQELAAFGAAVNRTASSRPAGLIAGFPDRGATITWQEVALPDRVIPVRVHRPRHPAGEALPLVVHVHGGGYMGTAAQCDWANSHFAARLPAVVVSVEHRLLAPDTPLSAAVDDGWDVLRHVVADAADWGIDPARVAVAGESCGGLIAAVTAIRARDAGLAVRAQILVNPAVDPTASMLDYPSMTDPGDSPMLTLARLRYFQRLALPPGADPAAVSPIHADLRDLAPALVLVPTVDPLADHGRRYAQRLQAAGTPALLREHPGAPHAFITLPGLVRQAKTARAQMAEFLADRLAAQPVPRSLR